MPDITKIINETHVRAYRLKRTRKLLVQFNIDAAVLDPLPDCPFEEDYL